MISHRFIGLSRIILFIHLGLLLNYLFASLIHSIALMTRNSACLTMSSLFIVHTGPAKVKWSLAATGRMLAVMTSPESQEVMSDMYRAASKADPSKPS